MTASSVLTGPLDLTDIRARLTAATSGPWSRGTDDLTVTAGSWPIAIVGVSHDDITVDYEDDSVFFDHVNNSADADLDLITHAPEDINALLDEVDRLNDALQEIDWLIETVDPDTFVHKVQIVLEDNL
ncbi:hypothetical protein [Actinomyces naeslundii]|jgi:hypothetical protein|uniref:hypothetical protein n=1 Tax=Actinomyces naeslundii TaxID=1655 RepID=UPI00096FB41A|nr:hypothetical protein [Actinomyces naeslundii]OMG07729.1 hypothetical protein BKH07_12005 [Actinomyces naeslundii]OMG16470.1 hypothetical protein BKH05_12075 [Actinomyces naeslundii]